MLLFSFLPGGYRGTGVRVVFAVWCGDAGCSGGSGAGLIFCSCASPGALKLRWTGAGKACWSILDSARSFAWKDPASVWLWLTDNSWIRPVRAKIHKGVCFGLAGQAADFHNTAESVDGCELRTTARTTTVRSIFRGCQFDTPWKSIQTVAVSGMNCFNPVNRLIIFQRNANLFAGHKEFVFIVLENLAGERAGTGFLLS